VKLTLFISLLLFVTVSFKSVTDKSPAIVEQEQGVFIFIKSKPVADYQYLGSVKKGMALTGAPAEMLKSMLSKCKKEYPQADGLIFNSIDMDKADCVKFK
jgi:hypothetical protein